MGIECPFSDKCKGAALCPSSDDACPSVTEVRIDQLTTERDQAIKALRAVIDHIEAADKGGWGVTAGRPAVLERARTIVTKYVGVEAEDDSIVPACCLGCLHDHTGMVGYGEFQRWPVGETCGARAEAEEERE
jgi:hypothetical protein